MTQREWGPTTPATTGHCNIAQLIGKKCKVWCYMECVKTQKLWDTGAQLSIMSEKLGRRHLTDTQIRALAGIMGDTEKLDLRAANGTEIPFLGWMDICFSLLDPKADVIARK